jgi:hypothetical protein
MSVETGPRRETARSIGDGMELNRARDPLWLDQREQQEQITAAVAAIVAKREVIEHAKGMLMVVYGVDADGAFELLRWHSQRYNVRLRLVAERITNDFSELARNRPLANRCAYDHLFLNAHVDVLGSAG